MEIFEEHDYDLEEEAVPPFLFQELRGGNIEHLRPIFALYGQMCIRDRDGIEHDPYVLISILSVLHEGEWTLAQVQGTLEMLFDRQYILTEDVVVEVRYRTETRTDSEGCLLYTSRCV